MAIDTSIPEGFEGTTALDKEDNQANPEVQQEAATFETDPKKTVSEGLPAGTGPAGTVEGVAGQYNDMAQRASEADSGDYAGYVNPETQIRDIAIATGEDYITPESTVAGQLQRLLSEDSPLRQQARREARETSSALGMLSSSAAVGDAYAKQVSALTPVAQADAESASKLKLQEQATKNKVAEIQVEASVSGSLTQQKADIAEQQTRINQEWDALMNSMDTQKSAALEEWKTGLNMKYAEFESGLKEELQQMGLDHEMSMVLINQSNEANIEYQTSVAALLSNETFMDTFDGNPEAMNGFFNELYESSVVGPTRYNTQLAGVWDHYNAVALQSMINSHNWQTF